MSTQPLITQGFHHVTLVSTDAPRTLAFYRDLLGLELLWRRVYEEPEIREIVGVPAATSFDIAMLRVPGSEVEIELLEYRGCPRTSGATEPCNFGSGHFCLFVREIDGGAGLRAWTARAAEHIASGLRGEPGRRFAFRTADAWRGLLESAGFSVRSRSADEGTPFANVLLVGYREARNSRTRERSASATSSKA